MYKGWSDKRFMSQSPVTHKYEMTNMNPLIMLLVLMWNKLIYVSFPRRSEWNSPQVHYEQHLWEPFENFQHI